MDHAIQTLRKIFIATPVYDLYPNTGDKMRSHRLLDALVSIVGVSGAAVMREDGVPVESEGLEREDLALMGFLGTTSKEISAGLRIGHSQTSSIFAGDKRIIVAKYDEGLVGVVGDDSLSPDMVQRAIQGVSG